MQHPLPLDIKDSALLGAIGNAMNVAMTVGMTGDVKRRHVNDHFR